MLNLYLNLNWGRNYFRFCIQSNFEVMEEISGEFPAYQSKILKGLCTWLIDWDRILRVHTAFSPGNLGYTWHCRRRLCSSSDFFEMFSSSFNSQSRTNTEINKLFLIKFGNTTTVNMVWCVHHVKRTVLSSVMYVWKTQATTGREKKKFVSKKDVGVCRSAGKWRRSEKKD